MWFRAALVCCALTFLLHLTVLVSSGSDPVATPISALSRGPWGLLHTVGLALFGVSHLCLAIGLSSLDRGRLWPFARAFLGAGAFLLFYVAYYFATASDSTLVGADANDPLWLVASLTGLAMGALQPGLSRISRRLGLFSTVCLGIWLWLIPLILLVNDGWLGAYERIVGSVYIAWIAGVAYCLIRVVRESPLRKSPS
ncbi:MAG: DUF998 domain-containing protein [Lysobacterales bacterium]